MKDLTKRFKKSDDGEIEEIMDAEDATGDIDISSLEEEVTKTEFRTMPSDDVDTGLHNNFESSLEDLADDSIDLEEEILDDEEQEDEDFEEEDLAEESPVLKFLQSQLPIIYKLVKKDPAGKTSKVKAVEEDVEEDDEDDTSEKSFIEKQLPFLAKFSKKKNNDIEEEDSETEDGEELPKKKRKLNVIQVLIIVAVVFVGLEFLFPEEEPVAVPVLKKRARPVPVKPAEPTVNPEPPAVVENTDDNTQIEPTNPSEDNDVDPVDEPVDDTVTDISTTIEDPEVPVADTPTSSDDDLDDLFDDTSTTTTDNDSEDTTEPDIAPEPAPEPVELPVVNDDTNYVDDEETDIPTTPEPIAQPSDGEIFDDGIIDEVVDTSVSPNITDSILKSLEDKIAVKKEAQVLQVAVKPTNPPEYDFLGRGLVYNCNGKHWACLDSVSFTKCGENYSWNTQSSNAVECYPSELYDSVEDCTVVQQFKIDNVAETKFCGP